MDKCWRSFAITNATVFNKSTTIFHGLLRFQPCQLKKGRFLEPHSRAHERRRREPLGICASKMQFLAQSRSNPTHYRAQRFRRLMLGCQTGKNGPETTEKRQRIVQKRLVRQRKHCLFLARKSFKKQGGYFISKNERPEIFAEYERFKAKTGGLEFLGPYSYRRCAQIQQLLTNGRAANWAPEVVFSPFRALSRRQLTSPSCC